MNTQVALSPTDRIYTVPEVAAYLKISKSKVYYLMSRKAIPHLRLGRNVRIRGSDLEAWLETCVEQSIQVRLKASHQSLLRPSDR